MKPALLLLSLVWFAQLSATRAAPPATSPAQFAEGRRLEITPDLSVQTLLLPLDVYRGTRADQGDLCVFNARGEPVPFALRAVEQKVVETRRELAVPVFPLRAPKPLASSSGAVLHVERARDGTVLDVRLPAAETQNTDSASPIVAYVLSAEAIDYPPQRLRLELEPQAESYTAQVAVEGSDDLAHWAALAEPAVVGELNHAGQRIQRQDITLRGTPAKFLRVRGLSESLPAVRAAYLAYAQPARTPEPEIAQLRAVPVRAQEGVYELDLGGSLPLVSIDVELPDNVLLTGRLLLRDAPKAPGEAVFEGELYRLKHAGAPLLSERVELEARRARYVRLELESGTTPAFDGQLAFKLGYAPDQLLFVPQGPGPFLLAYGSYQRCAEALDARRLLAFLPEPARDALPRESVRLLEPEVLGGPAARTPPTPPPNYRRPVLWSVLVLGALILLVLALRQLRRIRKGG